MNICATLDENEPRIRGAHFNEDFEDFQFQAIQLDFGCHCFAKDRAGLTFGFRITELV